VEPVARVEVLPARAALSTSVELSATTMAQYYSLHTQQVMLSAQPAPVAQVAQVAMVSQVVLVLQTALPVAREARVELLPAREVSLMAEDSPDTTIRCEQSEIHIQQVRSLLPVAREAREVPVATVARVAREQTPVLVALEELPAPEEQAWSVASSTAVASSAITSAPLPPTILKGMLPLPAERAEGEEQEVPEEMAERPEHRVSGESVATKEPRQRPEQEEQSMSEDSLAPTIPLPQAFNTHGQSALLPLRVAPVEWPEHPAPVATVAPVVQVTVAMEVHLAPVARVVPEARHLSEDLSAHPPLLFSPVIRRAM